MRRCWAVTGVVCTMDLRTNVVFGCEKTASGAAECAETHTGHFAVSRALACTCAEASSAADRVSSRQNHAMCFAMQRI